MAIVTVLGVGVAVGVGLGVGGGFSMTNKGDGVGRAAESLNVGEVNTVMAVATSTRSVSRKRIAVRIIFSRCPVAEEGRAGGLSERSPRSLRIVPDHHYLAYRRIDAALACFLPEATTPVEGEWRRPALEEPRRDDDGSGSKLTM
jgi:hypothetical protein